MCIFLHFSAKLRTVAMLIQLDRVVATPRYISKLRAPNYNYVHLSHYSNGLNVHILRSCTYFHLQEKIHIK